MKINILAIMAHPDDAELCCGGTLLKHVDMGYSIGIIDLTEGELGTRGTAEIRRQEAETAGRLMKLSVRENLNMRDGWLLNDEAHKLKIIQKVRQYQPDIVITNATSDRHPDHGTAAKLVSEAAWLSGLKNIMTNDENGAFQTHWRPAHVYHVIQYMPLEPDFVVDIGGYVEKKMEVLMAYKSQFHQPGSTEDNTILSRPEFLDLIKAKTMHAGNYSLLDHAEGFISSFKPAVKSLYDLI